MSFAGLILIGFIILFVPLVIIFGIFNAVKAIKHKEQRKNRIIGVIISLLIALPLLPLFLSLAYQTAAHVGGNIYDSRPLPKAKKEALEQAEAAAEYFTELAEYELSKYVPEPDAHRNGIYPQGECQEARDVIFGELGFNKAYVYDGYVEFSNTVYYQSNLGMGDWTVLEISYYADGTPDGAYSEKITDKLYAYLYEISDRYYAVTTSPKPIPIEDKTTVAETAAPETTSSAAAVTSTTVPPTYEPDLSGFIKPELLTERVKTEAVKELDLKALEEMQGYDIDCNLEADEHYMKRRDAVEKQLTGDELEQFRSRNYFHEMWLEPFYLGNDTAEWVVVASYCTYNTQLAGYHQILYVKNGEIVRKSQVLNQGDYNGWKLCGNMLVSCATEKGVCLYDIESGGTNYIKGNPDAQQWEPVYYLTEDYMLFGNGSLALYDFKSGELTDTGINLCRDPYEYWAVKNNLLCFIEWDGDMGIYDMETRTLDRTAEVYEGMFISIDSDEYTVKSAYNAPEGSYDDASAIIAERKSDGEKICIDLTELCGGKHLMYGEIHGDWVILKILEDNDIAVNLSSMKAALFENGRYSGAACRNSRKYTINDVIFPEIP